MTHQAKPRFYLLTMALIVFQVAGAVRAQDASRPLRIGMIGLDTSHAPAFTSYINAADATGNLAKMQVVAAFPGGSDDIEASYSRIDGFTKKLADMGVEIVDSIDALLPKVDAVLLESVDGRKHLEQVLPVFKAGKPVFIDKPLAGDLADALAIDLLAKKYDARWFSSSSLRFSQDVIRYRDDAGRAESVRGASSWGPCSLEPSHTDLYWYGVHGVEMLYTAMGTGCQSISRFDGSDIVVVGQWQDGRIGTFRGIRGGKSGYGLVVFGKEAIEISDKYDGYAPLVDRIAEFFLGGEPAVSNEETLEMFTFMQAADVAKEQGGAAVPLAEVRARALEAAQQRVTDLDP